MLDEAWRRVCGLAEADDLAADLLSSIMVALFLPPETGMAWLGESVGEALKRRASRVPEPTPLRVETESDPIEWRLSPAERQAIARPDYAESAEFHYARAAEERSARNGQ